ncbi:hypothetical protein [Jeongeupia chitinilytica]|uniref:Uncharacterized protein n=1 Tax=Jeongeupia chitinilytica TaxID=1041641 RepID=A0ABQ3H2V8_9NEIS|nr:hypothetical protein [Jeongeupia chitinilytica]GHD62226.1 hypothetical protein GCM10007350_17860 [Jeongeupia chitinilytica]
MNSNPLPEKSSPPIAEKSPPTLSAAIRILVLSALAGAGAFWLVVAFSAPSLFDMGYAGVYWAMAVAPVAGFVTLALLVIQLERSRKAGPHALKRLAAIQWIVIGLVWFGYMLMFL